LPRQPIDELSRDDLFDCARGALHLDAVIAFEQSCYFLARGAQEFCNFVNPNSGHLVLRLFASGSR
jgi:hypothetical protein